MFRFSMKPTRILNQDIHDNFLRSINTITQKIIQERKQSMQVVSPFAPSSSVPSSSSYTWIFIPIGLFSLSILFYKMNEMNKTK